MLTRFLLIVLLLVLFASNVWAQTEDPQAGETATGRWLADAIHVGTSADCAIITATEVLGAAHTSDTQTTRATSVAPEPIVIVRASGAEIEAVLLASLRCYPRKSLRFPHTSGISASYHIQTKQITDLKINNSLIESNRVYRVATTGFLASGLFSDATIEEQQFILSLLTESYAKTNSPTTSQSNRINLLLE